MISCFGVHGAEPAGGGAQKANLPQTAPETQKKTEKMDFPNGTLRYESNSYQCIDRYMWTNVFLPGKASMEKAPTCIKRDKNVALKASECCPENLLHIHDSLRSDRGFVLQLIKKNGWALPYVHPMFILDAELCILAAVNEDCSTFYTRHESRHHSLLSYKDFHTHEILLGVVQRKASKIEYIPASLHTKEIVLATITQKPWLFAKVDAKFREDRGLVTAAVTSNGKALQYAAEKIKEDRDIVMAAVTSNGKARGYAAEKIKEDRDVVMVAVTSDGRALGYAKKFMDDREIVMAALASDGHAALCSLFRERSPFLFVLDIVLQAAKSGAKFDHISKNIAQFRNDREIALASLQAPRRGKWRRWDAEDIVDLFTFNPLFNSDCEIMLHVVKQNGSFLELCPFAREDKEIVLSAVQNDGLALACAHSNLQAARRSVLEAANQEGAAIILADSSL